MNQDIDWELQALKALSSKVLDLTLALNKDTRGSSFDRVSLRLFEWVVKHNVSEKQFDGVRKIIQEEFNAEIDSIRAMRRNLSSELGLYEKVYHCCVDNCMAFTPPFEGAELCRHCEKPRYYGAATTDREDLEGKPRAVYRYLALIPRLKLLYANKDYSKRMRYPEELLADRGVNNGNFTSVRDVWEGKRMTELKAQGTFSLTASLLTARLV
jgi:hypothetical protein